MGSVCPIEIENFYKTSNPVHGFDFRSTVVTVPGLQEEGKDWTRRIPGPMVVHIVLFGSLSCIEEGRRDLRTFVLLSAALLRSERGRES